MGDKGRYAQGYGEKIGKNYYRDWAAEILDGDKTAATTKASMPHSGISGPAVGPSGAGRFTEPQAHRTAPTPAPGVRQPPRFSGFTIYPEGYGRDGHQPQDIGGGNFFRIRGDGNGSRGIHARTVRADAPRHVRPTYLGRGPGVGSTGPGQYVQHTGAGTTPGEPSLARLARGRQASDTSGGCVSTSAQAAMDGYGKYGSTHRINLSRAAGGDRCGQTDPLHRRCRLPEQGRGRRAQDTAAPIYLPRLPSASIRGINSRAHGGEAGSSPSQKHRVHRRPTRSLVARRLYQDETDPAEAAFMADSEMDDLFADMDLTRTEPEAPDQRGQSPKGEKSKPPAPKYQKLSATTAPTGSSGGASSTGWTGSREQPNYFSLATAPVTNMVRGRKGLAERESHNIRTTRAPPMPTSDAPDLVTLVRRNAMTPAEEQPEGYSPSQVSNHLMVIATTPPTWKSSQRRQESPTGAGPQQSGSIRPPTLPPAPRTPEPGRSRTSLAQKPKVTYNPKGSQEVRSPRSTEVSLNALERALTTVRILLRTNPPRLWDPREVNATRRDFLHTMAEEVEILLRDPALGTAPLQGPPHHPRPNL